MYSKGRRFNPPKLYIRGWGEMYIQHKEKQFFVFQSSWKRKSTLNIYCVDLI